MQKGEEHSHKMVSAVFSEIFERGEGCLANLILQAAAGSESGNFGRCHLNLFSGMEIDGRTGVPELDLKRAKTMNVDFFTGRKCVRNGNDHSVQRDSRILFGEARVLRNCRNKFSFVHVIKIPFG